VLLTPLAETADLPVEATHPARRSGEGSVCQMSDSSRDGEELVTRRLSLRRPAPADVHVIFSINSDQRACAHNPSDMLATRDEAQHSCEPKTNQNPRYLRYSNAVSALLWIISDLQAEDAEER
jgi:hypothetical protein